MLITVVYNYPKISEQDQRLRRAIAAVERLPWCRAQALPAPTKNRHGTDPVPYATAIFLKWDDFALVDW